MGPGGLHVGQELVVHPCSTEGRKSIAQQVKGGDPSPLVSPGETTSEVLCLVLGSP